MVVQKLEMIMEINNARDHVYEWRIKVELNLHWGVMPWIQYWIDGVEYDDSIDVVWIWMMVDD